MANDDEGRRAVYRTSRGVWPGQPIQVSEQVEAGNARELSPLCAAMVKTLRAYGKAGRELVEGQYTSVRELAPPPLRVPCHISVVCCPDGVIVRYDAAGEEEPKVRGSCPDRHESLAEMAPAFSEQVIHVSDDPEMYVPKHQGRLWQLQDDETCYALLFDLLHDPTTSDGCNPHRRIACFDLRRPRRVFADNRLVFVAAAALCRGRARSGDFKYDDQPSLRQASQGLCR